MTIFGTHFLLLLLALLVSSFHTSDAYAGFVGDLSNLGLVSQLGEGTGGTNSTQGDGGSGTGDSGGLTLSSFLCGNDDTLAIVDLLCGFVLNGGFAIIENTSEGSTIDADGSTRKLIRGGN